MIIDSYKRLTDLLDKAPNFQYYNFSAPKEKPLFPQGTPLTNKKIAKSITNKIAPSQITIVISGMYVTYKDWIQYEINESVRMGKPILAIIPWGNKNIPKAISDVVPIENIVGWNTNSIVSAIRRLVP